MRLFLACLLALTLATGAALLPWAEVAPAGATAPRLVAGAARDIEIREPAYMLLADPRTAQINVATPLGLQYTSFPLTALAGFSALPKGATRQLRKVGADLIGTVAAADGTALETARLTPGPTSFTVTFTSRVGSDRLLRPCFFFDGRRGFDLRSVKRGFTPSEPGRDVALPQVVSVPRTALSPPPLDIELETQAGWLGVGVVQVPNATMMGLLPSGALQLDYPLDLLTTFPDRGAGGRVGSMVRFPSFVFTFASGAMAGLRAYDAALVQLGQAPATPARWPSWWQDPIIDTWGAQMVDGAERGSPRFTATWVEDFATGDQRRLGVHQLTIVIDSRWQQAIGEPAPDANRFGGWSGMRSLIDDLHRQGLRVILWWPLWVRGIETVPPTIAQLRGATAAQLVDPTASGFNAAMRETAQRLMGSGPGDLNADGLKLDWTYDIPMRVQNPALGWGDAALYHYLDAIHSAVHAVRPDALVEASAAAPQFSRVTDAVRLYDAWSQGAWDTRAATVSSADPTALIDGDGWRVPPESALPHAVSSTVYGVPAMYFGDRWPDGSPVSAATAKELGDVMALAALKGRGSARRLSDGEWAWIVDGTAQAQTFDGERDLLVWSTTCAGGRQATVVATSTGTVMLPVASGGTVRVVTASGRPVEPVGGSHGVTVPLVAGTTYRVQISSTA